ncbi:cohesin loading factor domain-containing protein [Neurospora intermedia]|uniref:Cohesin loading factor domain-containing protein n=1 Tax=Neurospora intermedia TaxID=5142 RepID=A0ABR3CZ16_NEUIN
MTYHDAMPPGQPYGIYPQQNQNPNQQPQQHQQQQQAQQAFQPVAGYHHQHHQQQQYVNGYQNGHPQYLQQSQHSQQPQVPYAQSAYSQAQPTFNSNNPVNLSNYSSKPTTSFAHTPQTTTAPVQFVDPSFLQKQYVPPVQTSRILPAPHSMTLPSPQLPLPQISRHNQQIPLQQIQQTTNQHDQQQRQHQKQQQQRNTPNQHHQQQARQQPYSQPSQPQSSPHVQTQQLHQPISRPNGHRPDERPLQPQATPAERATPRGPSRPPSVAKSSASAQRTGHVETLPLLLCVAEDCFAKAHAAASGIARSMSDSEVKEYHKMVATGLGCLEVAMNSNKLWPRLEARLCLRYASVLIEETTNIMEAETALTRGILVCEKHRFVDLKYCSQFLLMKTLFQRNPRAAFKSLDTHIMDATMYKHAPWVYAFRFLKAAFHIQSGTAADHHALENLRRMASIATTRDEKAMFVMVMLLEGLSHLNTMKDDWINRVQNCIAQAQKLQFDDAAHLPQLDVLLLLLDLACSLRQKSHRDAAQKLSVLQSKLEELRNLPSWSSVSHELLLPIRRVVNDAAPTLSRDTEAVLRRGDGTFDYLVLSALGKQGSFAMAYIFNGIVALYKSTTLGRSSTIWTEAVRLLEDKNLDSGPKPLPDALAHTQWAKGVSNYAQVLIGLQAATLSDWRKVKACLDALGTAQLPEGFLDVLTLYLTGVFKQGTCRLGEALVIWKDPRFAMDRRGLPQNNTSHIISELCILAALNRIWIMQAPAFSNDGETAQLLDFLRPLCEDNPDLDIRITYNLVLASITLDPPLPINQVKQHMKLSLNGAQNTSNTHFLSIALNIMRNKLFENVVGEQALKSARAGTAQARKSGNLLWMSVAEGMLAQSLEQQGLKEEAEKTREEGIRLANEARLRTQVE